jgi:hypothetical protein
MENFDLIGICHNSIRVFDIVHVLSNDLLSVPFLVNRNELTKLKIPDPLKLSLHVERITKPRDFVIFEAIHEGNWSRVIDMVQAHTGVNAVDEWGQTPLMIAVIQKNLPLIAELLNARGPTVDVNLAKAAGFTVILSLS